jgi:hypothetical protein
MFTEDYAFAGEPLAIKLTRSQFCSTLAIPGETLRLRARFR